MVSLWIIFENTPLEMPSIAANSRAVRPLRIFHTSSFSFLDSKDKEL